MTAADVLLARLERVKEMGQDRWLACCPGHDDRHPSLSVREEPDGRVLVHCFAGCDTGAVLSAVGLTLADLFPDRRPHHVRPSRSRIPPADVLAALAVEYEVVSQTAARLRAAGGGLPDAEWQRLERAAARIDAGLAQVRGTLS